MYKRNGADAVFGLALVGLLLLAWPRDSVLFATLLATISYVSWHAAVWMQQVLGRGVRVLLALGVTVAVASIHIMAPRGGEPLVTIALTGGSLALTLPVYLAAAWEVLPVRLTGRDPTKRL